MLHAVADCTHRAIACHCCSDSCFGLPLVAAPHAALAEVVIEQAPGDLLVACAQSVSNILGTLACQSEWTSYCRGLGSRTVLVEYRGGAVRWR